MEERARGSHCDWQGAQKQVLGLLEDGQLVRVPRGWLSEGIEDYLNPLLSAGGPQDELVRMEENPHAVNSLELSKRRHRGSDDRRVDRVKNHPFEWMDDYEDVSGIRLVARQSACSAKQYRGQLVHEWRCVLQGNLVHAAFDALGVKLPTITGNSLRSITEIPYL